MIDQTIAHKVKRLELLTRRRAQSVLSGSTITAQKGVGLEFDQIREYQLGDDVRFIDWKSSARANKLLVKQYVEERVKTVMIALDCSASLRCGSGEQLKSDVAQEIAAMLAYVACVHKDRFGLIVFADDVQQVIPPGFGMRHLRYVLQTIVMAYEQEVPANTDHVFAHFHEVVRRNNLLIMISDFLDEIPSADLRALGKRFDCMAIACNDAVEYTMPAGASLVVRDPETGAQYVLDVSTQRAVDRINKTMHERYKQRRTQFAQSGVDLVEVRPDQDYIATLAHHFQRRILM